MQEAKKLKHAGDKLKNSAEKIAVIECYLEAGIKFLEYSFYLEDTEQIEKARTFYQQTARFFETVASLCLEEKRKNLAGLWYVKVLANAYCFVVGNVLVFL